MRIIFFGTPDFSVPSLKRLAASHAVIAVVTQPDKPKGRGQEIRCSPVKETAQFLQIPVLQPQDIHDPLLIQKIKSLNPDCAVVIAYGKILPVSLLNLFPLKAVNVHASLLPKYRGAAPIQWALIHGETETGVTIIFMNDKVDYGPILLQASCPIRMEDTAVSLGTALADLGSGVLLRALEMIEQGSARPMAQNDAHATYAPRLSKQDGMIDWKATCMDIHNRIRGVQPWPGAMTWLSKEMLKIYSTRVEPSRHQPELPPGTVAESSESNGLWVQTGMGHIRIDRLQREGGAVLEIKQFLRGTSIPTGTLLTSFPV